MSEFAVCLSMTSRTAASSRLPMVWPHFFLVRRANVSRRLKGRPSRRTSLIKVVIPVPPPRSFNFSDKMSRSRLTDDDIADFVAMLLVKIYTKNSGMDQPLQTFIDSARKHGNAPLAACLETGIETYSAVAKLLQKKRRLYRKLLPSTTWKAAAAPIPFAKTRGLYRSKSDSKEVQACQIAIHYEAIAEALLRNGLKVAKEGMFAPNTYYTMKDCIRNSDYHAVMRKKIKRALMFNPSAQNATQGHS